MDQAEASEAARRLPRADADPPDEQQHQWKSQREEDQRSLPVARVQDALAEKSQGDCGGEPDDETRNDEAYPHNMNMSSCSYIGAPNASSRYAMCKTTESERAHPCVGADCNHDPQALGEKNKSKEPVPQSLPGRNRLARSPSCLRASRRYERSRRTATTDRKDESRRLALAAVPTDVRCIEPLGGLPPTPPVRSPAVARPALEL
jgi:hypothetical protein